MKSAGYIKRGKCPCYCESLSGGHTGRRILEGAIAMLAEKFFLVIETLRSRGYPDGSPRVVSTSPHVPVKLPDAKDK